MNRDDVELIKHETLFQGFFQMDRITVRHRLFAGGMGEPVTREVFERGMAAACLPYDPERDKLVLIEQFRPGPYTAGDPEPWLIEAVAGVVEPGESVEDVVQREALEEIGRPVTDLIPIVDFYPTPGGSSERIALFLGRVDAEGVEGIYGVDEGEDIRASVVSFDEAMRLFDVGRITNANLILPLLWLALHRDRLRKSWSAR